MPPKQSIVEQGLPPNPGPTKRRIWTKFAWEPGVTSPVEEQQEDGRKVKRRINAKTSVANVKRKNDVLEMEEKNAKGQKLLRRRITGKTTPEEDPDAKEDDSRTSPVCAFKGVPPREQARFQTAAMGGRSEEGQNEKKAADMPRPKMGGKEAREKAEKEAEAADEVESRGTKGSPSHPILPKENRHTPLKAKSRQLPTTPRPTIRPPTKPRVPMKSCF